MTKVTPLDDFQLIRRVYKPSTNPVNLPPFDFEQPQSSDIPKNREYVVSSRNARILCDLTMNCVC